jgi:lipopolysaccharide cholinephosphotransferase
MVDTRIKGRMLLRARRLLNKLVDFLESEGIEYHLEGGTLLGLVRDGEFLEWDFDLDISIVQGEEVKFLKKRYKLWLSGYRVSKRRSKVDFGPIKKGDLRILKVKHIASSWFANFSPWMRKNLLVADVFIKFVDDKDAYWIAKRRVMKVPAYHYSGHELIEYNGRSYMVPVAYKDYLTAKYGDWSIPVKEWNCAHQEKTVISSIETAD